MQYALYKVTSNWRDQMNVVEQRSICLQLVVEWKYYIAENGKT